LLNPLDSFIHFPYELLAWLPKLRDLDLGHLSQLLKRDLAEVVPSNYTAAQGVAWFLGSIVPRKAESRV